MNNKVAVITGAASGIGLALAKACIMDGMNVVMTDINESALDDQINQIKQMGISMHTDILSVVCDVSNKGQVEQLAKQTLAHFGRVDLLINNAGIIGHLAPVWELSTDNVRHVLDVNLYGVLHCVQAFLPLMFEQPHRSHIVNMASAYGLCSGSQVAAYAMSKHGVVALSESLYFDLQRLQKPIDISVACPSFIDTPLLVNSAQFNSSGLHSKMEDLMTRCRSAEDVAECIMREIKNKTFYILPDKEVKSYCEQRAQTIMEQTMPYAHGLEKILTYLSKSVP